MITLPSCRLAPIFRGQSEGYRSRRDYLHLPVRTANMARFLTALERPVIVPLLHLTYGCHRWSGRRI